MATRSWTYVKDFICYHIKKRIDLRVISVHMWEKTLIFNDLLEVTATNDIENHSDNGSLRNTTNHPDRR